MKCFFVRGNLSHGTTQQDSCCSVSLAEAKWAVNSIFHPHPEMLILGIGFHASGEL
jgi:hypothetical protein